MQHIKLCLGGFKPYLLCYKSVCSEDSAGWRLWTIYINVFFSLYCCRSLPITPITFSTIIKMQYNKKPSVSVCPCVCCWISTVCILTGPLPSPRHVEVISAQMCSSLKQRQQRVWTWSGYTDKLAHFPPTHTHAHSNTHTFMHAYTHKCTDTKTHVCKWTFLWAHARLTHTAEKLNNHHFNCVLLSFLHFLIADKLMKLRCRNEWLNV